MGLHYSFLPPGSYLCNPASLRNNLINSRSSSLEEILLRSRNGGLIYGWADLWLVLFADGQFNPTEALVGCFPGLLSRICCVFSYMFLPSCPILRQFFANSGDLFRGCSNCWKTPGEIRVCTEVYHGTKQGYRLLPIFENLKVKRGGSSSKPKTTGERKK